MKKHVKFLAAVMSIIMIITALPSAVFATEFENEIEDSAENENIVEDNIIDLSKVSIISEDISRRNEKEKHFLLDDGTSLAVLYSQPVHELDEDGNWIDIDNSFSSEEADLDGIKGYVKRNDLINVKISDNTHIDLTDPEDAYPISLELAEENANYVPAEETTNIVESENTVYERNTEIIEEAIKVPEINFSNVLNGVDIISASIPLGINESIIIDSTLDEYSFSFLLATGEMTASVNDDGEICISDENDTPKYYLPLPFMHDGENRYSDDVSYMLWENDDGNAVLTVTADSESINSDDFVFPVTVEFSISTTAEVTASSENAHISSENPDTVYSGTDILKVGVDADGNVNRAFLSLDEMPELTVADIMLSAKFHMYQYRQENQDSESTFAIEEHLITEPWDVSAVTWNSQPEYSDYVYDNKTYNNGDSSIEVSEWDITKHARNFYENEESYGIAFVSADEKAFGYISFLTSSAMLNANSYIFVNYYCNSQANTDTAYSPDIDTDSQNEYNEVNNQITDSENIDSDFQAESGYSLELPDPTVGGGKAFQDVTNDIAFEYCDGNYWHSFSGSTGDVGQINSIRILTGGKPYYFKYKTRNAGAWLGQVLSTSANDYAGLSSTAASDLAIEVYEGSARIHDNYVVMYRAKVAGNWLDWVSNGKPDVMRTIQIEYSLGGALDTAATYAGWYSLGNLQALEIHVYERTGYSESVSNSREFEEITSAELSQRYCVGDSWNSLNASVDVSMMEGIQLITESNEFFLVYKTKHESGNETSKVLSSDENKSAYIEGDPIRNIWIEVYANDARVFDDYVVMYRAKVAGAWLDWVSNGRSDVMQTIQYEFNLDGNLDTYSTDAGWFSRGNIQSVEIRLFKRTNASGSSANTKFKLADGITMQYSKDYKWYNASNNILTGPMDGVILRTSGKPYYLRYCSKNVDKGWLDYVNSTDSGQDDYAGWYGYPMTNLSIEVYSGSTPIYSNYVVMYRAKVAGEWLDWASNARPEIMRSIQSQFNLSGGLDISATNAGWASRGNIEALEIRVYEPDGDLDSTGAKVIINAPYINQNQADVKLPNGCESVSAVMDMQYFNMAIDPKTFVTDYLPKGDAPRGTGQNRIGSDPSLVYVGDPSKTNGQGWGCYAPVIVKSVKNYFKKNNIDGFSVTELSNVSLDRLCSEYIDNNIPVIMWATVSMTSNCSYSTWTASDGSGKVIRYNNKLHCLLLVGYDDYNYYFNDPLEFKEIPYPKKAVDDAYKLLGSQAVVITNNIRTVSEQKIIPETPMLLKLPAQAEIQVAVPVAFPISREIKITK